MKDYEKNTNEDDDGDHRLNYGEWMKASLLKKLTITDLSQFSKESMLVQFSC